MRQLQENETDTKTHVMEANITHPHAGGPTSLVGEATKERCNARTAHIQTTTPCTSRTYNAPDSSRHAAMASSAGSWSIRHARSNDTSRRY